MQLERFEALAQAWGAAVDGWPVETQAPARALLARRPEAAAEALAAAAALDELLDASPRAPPSSVLRDAILASVPPRRRVAGRWFAWASGAGLAAATAGAACGALFTSVSSDRPPEALIQAASEIAPTPIELSGREAL